MKNKSAHLRSIISSIPTSNIITDYVEKFLAEVENMGEQMTRNQFWDLIDSCDKPRMFDSRNNVTSAHLAWTDFINKARLITADPEYWNQENVETLTEISTGILVRDKLLPSDFVKLGGEPDWIQSQSIPQCQKCKFAMQLFVQVKSPSSVGLRDISELTDFEQSDSGTTYIFRCYQCSEYNVIEQFY